MRADASAAPRAVAPRPGHADQKLGGRDLQRAQFDGTGAHPGREVVVVALEAPARDAQRRGERVQLLEGTVHGHVAPVLDREGDVVVVAERIDEYRHGSPGSSW